MSRYPELDVCETTAEIQAWLKKEHAKIDRRLIMVISALVVIAAVLEMFIFIKFYL